MPKVIKVDYLINTPMFIGNAEQKASHISPASVKGALRFWWRALNWARLRNQATNDANALRQLHQQECNLFGDADKGQGAFLLKISHANLKPIAKTDKPNAGIQYLLGQGLYHFNNGYLRGAFQSGQTFNLRCVLKPNITPELTQQLEQALLAFGLLGGLGSRARKGFGSISIQSIEGSDLTIPKDKYAFKKQIEEWQNTLNIPPFSAFSKETRFDISLTGRNALSLLNEAAKEQQFYRSYGRNVNGIHQVNGRTAEPQFKADHDLMLDVSKGKRITKIPERTVFGLPHNYHFSNGANIEFGVNQKDKTRRASPLFIHLHQFKSGEVILLHTLMPALFLPNKTPLETKTDRKTNTLLFNESMIDWKVITTYLDRFNTKETI